MWFGAGLGLVCALVFTACGSSSDSTSSGGSVSESDLAKYQATLDDWYKGTHTLPTGEVKSDVPTGKNVWVISTGQSIETAQEASKAMQEAGDALGWDVTIFDGKFDSNRELTGIEQAIADGADGLVLLYVDCAPVKAGLQEAKDAGIKIVGIESADCDPPLMDHVATYAGGADWRDWIKNSWGKAQADWVIAKTEGEAKVILVEETDLETTRLTADGEEETINSCPTCEVVDTVKFVGTEFGPPLQQKIEQSLNSHPEANALIASYDAVLTGGGGAAAVRSSGRNDDMYVMGGEGSTPGIELIYNNAGMDACVGLNTGQEGYAAMDGLVRIFVGQDPAAEDVDTGVGNQACDIDNNLPPKGDIYEPPVDYAGGFQDLWGVNK